MGRNDYRVLNYVPSPVDPRDVPLRAMLAMRGARRATAVPAYVSLRAGCGPIRDQGQTGECTGQALVGASEYLDAKSHGGALSARRGVKYAYYNGRRMMFPSQVRVDSGCYIRTVLKAGVRYGVCREEFWPESSPFDSKPSVAAYADGSVYQITEYGACTGEFHSNTVDLIRESIAAGLPVMMGFDVYRDAFMSDEVAKTGVAKVPKRGDIREGGHAVLIVGYDDASSMFSVRNSWGEEWGDHGYFTLPYWYVLYGHASDFWAVSAQENGDGTAKFGWFSGLPGYLFGHMEKEIVK